MKILKLFIPIMILLCLIGCKSRLSNSKLTQVDSLLDNNQLDSAKQILNVMHNTLKFRK